MHSSCRSISVISSAVQEIFPLIAGFGVGGLFFPPIVAMQAAMPLKDMATSTATVGLLRQLGSTIGVSIGQAVWSSVRTPPFCVSCFVLRRGIVVQELRSRLQGVQGIGIDTSSSGLADSVRQLKDIQARMLFHFLAFTNAHLHSRIPCVNLCSMRTRRA